MASKKPDPEKAQTREPEPSAAGTAIPPPIAEAAEAIRKQVERRELRPLKKLPSPKDERQWFRRLLGIPLIIAVALQVLFLDWVMIRVGKGDLDFADSTTIDVFVGGTIVQVTALAYVAVSYYFKE